MSPDQARHMIQRLLGDKCAIKTPQGPLTGWARSHTDDLLSSGHLYHNEEMDYIALTNAGRKVMGIPVLECDLVFDPHVIPNRERMVAVSVMERHPAGLRLNMDHLRSLEMIEGVCSRG